LLLPTRGRAQVCGFDVARESQWFGSRSGITPAPIIAFTPGLVGAKTFICFAALNNLSQHEASRRIEELTELFGLGALLDHQVTNSFDWKYSSPGPGARYASPAIRFASR